MERRTEYYTDTEEIKKILFFDPRAVEVRYFEQYFSYLGKYINKRI